MSDHSPIQWCDATLNAIVGCDYVSTGCLHCYAATLHNRRYLAWKRGTFPTAPTQYHQPFKRVQLMPERLLTPFRWRTPKRVFVNSMSDLWHEDVPDWFIARTWAMMALTPQHIWQVLTKRPERMCYWLRTGHYDEVLHEANYLRAQFPRKRLGDIAISNPARFPLENVWLGVSVENQQAADERIPYLLQTPAAVRFLSCEPLLGSVDLIGDPGDGVYGPIWQKRAVQQRTDYGSGVEWDVELESGISWCIIGGESGAHARVMNPAWALSLIEQCREAEIPVFMKQLGSELAYYYSLKDKHGGDMEAWPPDFDQYRVREFPQTTRDVAEVAP